MNTYEVRFILRNIRFSIALSRAILEPMEYEPKWLVIYALALEAQERGLQDVSDALMRRALVTALQSDESLALVAKKPVHAFQSTQGQVRQVVS